MLSGRFWFILCQYLCCNTQYSHVNCFHLEMKILYFSKYKNYKKHESFISLLETLGMRSIGPNLRISAPCISFIHSLMLVEHLWAPELLGIISEQNRLGYLPLQGYLLGEGKRSYTINNKHGILNCILRLSWGRIPSIYLFPLEFAISSNGNPGCAFHSLLEDLLS